MSSEQFREQGIQAAKERRVDDARRLLQQAIKLNPQDETAWLYLASIASDKKERLVYLQKVLQLNPQNELGRKAVQAMGIDPEQVIALKPAQPTTPESPAAARPPEPTTGIRPLRPAAPPPTVDDAETFDEFEDEEIPDIDEVSPDQDEVELAPVSSLPLPPPPDPSAPPGIPVPDVNYLEEVLIHAEGIAKRHSVAPASDIEWIHKEKGRAGERDILELRLRIAGAVLGVLVVFGGIFGIFLATNPQAQATILGIRTRTATSTPTLTPTNTPGLTPTPSATLDTTLNPTYTPTPTIPLTLSPVGNINVTPRPTTLKLPEPPGRAILDAALAIERGGAAAILPTLEAERQNTSRVFNPNPYYYEARAQLAQGRIDRAEALISEAEGRLDDVNVDQARRYKVLVDLGAAEIEVQRGVNALAARNRAAAQSAFQAAQGKLEEVIAFDSLYARAHVLLARTDSLLGNYTDAIATLDQAMLTPQLAVDVNIILEKAEIYFAQARSLRTSNPAAAREAFQRAEHEAYYAYFLNPYEERAHDLRIQAALELGEPGQAVLNTLDYLFYHPNSAKAFRLLGIARTAEGNHDLALEAYTRALENVEDDETRADIVLSRATLFTQQGRYQQALEDYNVAYEIRETPEIRALRMQTAYLAGDLDTASRDASALLGSGEFPDEQIRFIQARVLIDQATEGDTQDYQQALSLLNAFSNESLPVELRPVADEYRARAHFRLGNLTDALNSINRALQTVETGSGHYLRGQILQANARPGDAIRDYEWVLAWNTVYDFLFAPEVEEHIQTARDEVRDAIIRATQEAAVTPTPEVTATP